MTDGPIGVCGCPCQPDDPDTPLENEDKCPEQPTLRCARVPTTGGATVSTCVRTCEPRLGSSDCEPPLACRPDSATALGLLERAACVFRGCGGGIDCPVRTTIPCIPGVLDCPQGMTCDSAQRGVAGSCALPGSCDQGSGLCAAHPYGVPTARVGDPCRSDLECGGAMTCLRQLDPATLLRPSGAACNSGIECCGGVCSAGRCQARPCPVLYRNGYCTVQGCSFARTLSDRACPPDSACNRYHEAGLCQRRCDPVQAKDCRGHAADQAGDYECRNWSTLLLGGQPLALDPVCDFGPLVACDALQSDGLTCGVFGVDSLGRLNVTHMTCRTLQGAATADPFDRGGFCLDDTASGAARRSP